jgi:hypothetical protein
MAAEEPAGAARERAIVWGCMTALLLVIAGGAASAVWLVLRPRAPGPVQPDPVTTAPQPVEPVFPPRATAEPSPERAESERDASEPDAGPTVVDLVDPLPEAKRRARELQTGAQLLLINATQLRRGAFDVSQGGGILYHFEYVGKDATKPPGLDQVKRTIMVTFGAGGMSTNVQEGHAFHLDAPNHFFGGPQPDPLCSSRAAWRAAVASGVPDDAVARMMLLDESGAHVWSIRVDGHDEMRREIDARTCAMVRNWGAGTRGHATPRAGGSRPEPASAPAAQPTEDPGY